MPSVLNFSGAQRNAIAHPQRITPIRLLFIIDTGFPTFRPDIAALFGIYLRQLDIRTDIVAEQQHGDAGWPAGALHLSPRSPARIRTRLCGLLNVARQLWRVPASCCTAIQVRNQAIVALFALCAARRAGVPFFFWMSYPIADSAIRRAQQDGNALRRLYLAIGGRAARAVLHRVVLPHAAHIFVQSDRMRADLARRGVPLCRITAVPMGIDPARFATPTRPATDPRLHGKRVIAYLGACERIRGVDFLFDVVARLRTRHPNITLLIIGDAAEPSDKAWLRQRMNAFDIAAHVIITGWQTQAVAQSYLANAEIALSPLPPDPLLDPATPTKLVEYLAMGKPVVASNHPDQSLVIAESGAGFCTPFEPGCFAEKIALLLARPDLRQAMAARGPGYVLAHRSYEVIARRVHDVYASFHNADGLTHS